MLPHIIRCGGPKGKRKPIAWVNPSAADFNAVNNRFLPGDTITFTRTAPEYTDQSFTLPLNNAKRMQFTIDGAQGGKDGLSFNTFGAGQVGARSTATIDIATLQTTYPSQSSLLVYLGGKGENAGGHDGGGTGGRGGANGGGKGWGSGGPGGGGRTDVRRTASNTTEVLVAAGGGAGASGSVGNSVGNQNGVRVNGSDGGGGMVGDYWADTGGGGGGYYGGQSEFGDDPSRSYGGSSWADPACTTGVTLSVGGGGGTGFAYITILA
jgi:hypothetical protein